jgi:hypothetical protein
MPAASDVRDGVSYASGALTGSCKVPAAGSVALGVPVDATTGTAVLTPAAVWNYATREITGGTVTTLTNAPASVTPSDIWNYATRTITANSDITAIKAKTDLLETTRLAQCSTVATTGAQLAAALS